VATRSKIGVQNVPNWHCRGLNFAYSSRTKQSVIHVLADPPGSPNRIFRFLSALGSGAAAVFQGIIRFYTTLLRYRTSDDTLGPFQRVLGFSVGLLVFVCAAPMAVGIINPGYPSSILNLLLYDWISALLSLTLGLAIAVLIGFYMEVQGVFMDHFIRGIVFIPSTILLVVMLITVVAFCVTMIQSLFLAITSIPTAVKGIPSAIKGLVK